MLIKRTPLILSVIVLLPVTILAWFAIQHQSNQQLLLQHQFSNLIELRLQSIDRQLQEHFQALQRRLLPDAQQLQQQNPSYPAEALRKYTKSSPWLSQIFVLGADAERIFPPQAKPLNKQEQAFVRDSGTLLSSPQLFTQQRPELEAGSPIEPQLSQRDSNSSSRLKLYSAPLPQASNSEADLALATETGPHGWLAWYADTGLQHIFWWQDPEGQILGFVLNGARLLSDLLNRLPEGDANDLAKAEIRLINNRDEVIYSWGQYQPAEQASPLKIRALSHPIGSWRLAYFSPRLQTTGTDWLGVASWLLLLTAGLGTLAFLLYRAHIRELRLAEQRVNFVNQVSHELKTPLTNVRLYAEMLEQELPEPEEEPLVRRYLSVITSESQRLSRLIDNVLSFSRLRRDALKVTLQSGQIDHCIDQVIENFAPALRDRELQVSFQAEAADTRLFDCQALEQILNNLISNSEKYAASGKKIDIHSWQDAANSYIRIRDYGPGIQPEQSEKIFSPFYRISNKLTDGVSGTGIGLGLARDLARAHGGDLVLEKRSEKEPGASFVLQIATPASDDNQDQ
ncbi:MAG: HAMP domain-containing histidine kinase [Motiliproteus sp.]|nr:HAMP domain-containing histidine kinase [Motiliproteus sp.]MCW9052118.1 HAMP domain-containing histidine kinase [Motiliproteus sp.]